MSDRVKVNLYMHSRLKTVYLQRLHFDICYFLLNCGLGLDVCVMLIKCTFIYGIFIEKEKGPHYGSMLLDERKMYDYNFLLYAL